MSHNSGVCFLLLLSMGISLASNSIGEDALPAADALLKKAIVSDGNQARLQQFFKKAYLGDKVTFGVIGGSITEGALCPEPSKRYHGVVLSWLEKKFPKTKLSFINAGIGATGSDYGALRVERDLLSKNPDLVVLEYAVNDSNTQEMAEAYEGIVRQILKSKNHPALLLLFMMKDDGSNAQEWESKVGEKYGLPMISYRDALWPEIQAGSLKWSQISPDTIHPNQQGHTFAGQLICAFLERSLKTHGPRATPVKDLSAFPAPLISDAFEHCILYDGEALAPASNKGWVFDGSNKRFAGWKSSTPGSVLEFEIYSHDSIFLSFYYINGPMGKVKATVNNEDPVILDAWFPQTWGGKRQMAQIAKGLNPGNYKIKVELIQERNPKSSGNEFRILALGSTAR